MKKIKTIIISIFLFLIVYIISNLLLENIVLSYYNCSLCFPFTECIICVHSPWTVRISFVLGLGIAIYYFYRSSSLIKSNQKVEKLIEK